MLDAATAGVRDAPMRLIHAGWRAVIASHSPSAKAPACTSVHSACSATADAPSEFSIATADAATAPAVA